jgi:nitrite reductase (NADH) large subunit
MNYLIIGGGPAGMSTAAVLRRIHPESKITLLSKEKVNPYAKMLLPYLLDDPAHERDIFLPIPERVEVLLGREVAKIDVANSRVVSSTGETFPYQRLLIASGAHPVKPKIKGAELPFVFTIRDLADIQSMQARMNGKRGRAVIAGAGPVGLEVGDALHKRGFTITYVIGSDRIFSTSFDLAASKFVEGRLAKKGVEVRTGEDIVEVREDGEVVFKSQRTLKCDLVIFGKGVRPTIGFLAESGIKVKTGIVVDEHQETNIAGIYAAGDVAETQDVVHDDWRVNSLWPVAVEQGRIAAFNMASIQVPYKGSFGRNIMRVFGMSIFTAGMGQGEGPGVQCKEGRDFYHKVFLDKGILKGAIFIGELKRGGLYVNLMQQGIDVSGFSSSVLAGTFYPPHLHPRNL